jgi:hypothetical protein
MTDKLVAYMDEHHIGEDDLLFPYSLLRAEWEQAHPQPLRRTLAVMPGGLPPAIAPNGRAYAHGTPNAYDTGGCRCEWCRLAKAEQRARRRAEGKDRPPTGHSRRGKNVTDHCPDGWFRENLEAGADRSWVFPAHPLLRPPALPCDLAGQLAHRRHHEAQGTDGAPIHPDHPAVPVRLGTGGSHRA